MVQETPSLIHQINNTEECRQVCTSLVCRTMEKILLGRTQTNRTSSRPSVMQIHSMLSHHGKQNWDEPLPLAISYYQLYCDIAAEANISTSAITTSGESDKNEGGTTVTTTPKEQSDDDEVPCDLLQSEQEPTANHEQQQQQQPWVEDTEWDAVREAAAERELRDNMARCRISSSTTAARSVPNAAPSKAAAAAWDQFYQHHQTSFFKDRHWPAVAFPNEFSAGGVLVEVGCGVGNTLLPLLEKTNNKENAQTKQKIKQSLIAAQNEMETVC